MILAEQWHTPIPFWLELPLIQLLHWIKDNNDIINGRRAQK